MLSVTKFLNRENPLVNGVFFNCSNARVKHLATGVTSERLYKRSDRELIPIKKHDQTFGRHLEGSGIKE